MTPRERANRIIRRRAMTAFQGRVECDLDVRDAIQDEIIAAIREAYEDAAKQVHEYNERLGDDGLVLLAANIRARADEVCK